MHHHLIPAGPTARPASPVAGTRRFSRLGQAFWSRRPGGWAAAASLRPFCRRRRIASDRAQPSRRRSPPRLRPHQGVGGTLEWLLQPEPRRHLSDADLSGGSRARHLDAQRATRRSTPSPKLAAPISPRTAKRPTRSSPRIKWIGDRLCAGAELVRGPRGRRGRDRDIPDVIPELNEARRALKSALAAKLGASADEQRRIAELLRKAANEIEEIAAGRARHDRPLSSGRSDRARLSASSQPRRRGSGAAAARRRPSAPTAPRQSCRPAK